MMNDDFLFKGVAESGYVDPLHPTTTPATASSPTVAVTTDLSGITPPTKRVRTDKTPKPPALDAARSESPETPTASLGEVAAAQAGFTPGAAQPTVQENALDVPIGEAAPEPARWQDVRNKSYHGWESDGDEDGLKPWTGRGIWVGQDGEAQDWDQPAFSRDGYTAMRDEAKHRSDKYYNWLGRHGGFNNDDDVNLYSDQYILERDYLGVDKDHKFGRKKFKDRDEFYQFVDSALKDIKARRAENSNFLANRIEKQDLQKSVATKLEYLSGKEEFLEKTGLNGLSIDEISRIVRSDDVDPGIRREVVSQVENAYRDAIHERGLGWDFYRGLVRGGHQITTGVGNIWNSFEGDGGWDDWRSDIAWNERQREWDEVYAPRYMGSITDIKTPVDGLRYAAESLSEQLPRTALQVGVATIPGVGIYMSKGLSYVYNLGEAYTDQMDEGLRINHTLANGQAIFYTAVDQFTDQGLGLARRVAGRGVLSPAARAIRKNFTKSGIEGLGKFIAGALKEGAGEAVQSQIGGRLRRAIQTGGWLKDGETNKEAAMEAAEEFVGGAIAGLFFGGISTRSNYTISQNRVRNADNYIRVVEAAAPRGISSISDKWDRVAVAEASVLSMHVDEASHAMNETTDEGKRKNIQRTIDMLTKQRDAYLETLSGEARGAYDAFQAVTYDASNVTEENLKATGASFDRNVRMAVVRDEDGNEIRRFSDPKTGIVITWNGKGWQLANNPKLGLKEPQGVVTVFDENTPRERVYAEADKLAQHNAIRAKNIEARAATVRAVKARMEEICGHKLPSIVFYDSVNGLSEIDGVDDETVKAAIKAQYDRNQSKLLSAYGANKGLGGGKSVIFINADMCNSPAKLASTLMHEDFHGVVESMVNDELNGGMKWLRDIANEFSDDMGDDVEDLVDNLCRAIMFGETTEAKVKKMVANKDTNALKRLASKFDAHDANTNPEEQFARIRERMEITGVGAGTIESAIKRFARKLTGRGITDDEATNIVLSFIARAGGRDIAAAGDMVFDGSGNTFGTDLHEAGISRICAGMHINPALAENRAAFIRRRLNHTFNEVLYAISKARGNLTLANLILMQSERDAIAADGRANVVAEPTIGDREDAVRRIDQAYSNLADLFGDRAEFESYVANNADQETLRKVTDEVQGELVDERTRQQVAEDEKRRKAEEADRKRREAEEEARRKEEEKAKAKEEAERKKAEKAQRDAEAKSEKERKAAEAKAEKERKAKEEAERKAADKKARDEEREKARKEAEERRNAEREAQDKARKAERAHGLLKELRRVNARLDLRSTTEERAEEYRLRIGELVEDLTDLGYGDDAQAIVDAAEAARQERQKQHEEQKKQPVAEPEAKPEERPVAEPEAKPQTAPEPAPATAPSEDAGVTIKSKAEAGERLTKDEMKALAKETGKKITELKAEYGYMVAKDGGYVKTDAKQKVSQKESAEIMKLKNQIKFREDVIRTAPDKIKAWRDQMNDGRKHPRLEKNIHAEETNVARYEKELPELREKLAKLVSETVKPDTATVPAAVSTETNSDNAATEAEDEFVTPAILKKKGNEKLLEEYNKLARERLGIYDKLDSEDTTAEEYEKLQEQAEQLEVRLIDFIAANNLDINETIMRIDDLLQEGADEESTTDSEADSGSDSGSEEESEEKESADIAEAVQEADKDNEARKDGTVTPIRLAAFEIIDGFNDAYDDLVARVTNVVNSDERYTKNGKKAEDVVTGLVNSVLSGRGNYQRIAKRLFKYGVSKPHVDILLHARDITHSMRYVNYKTKAMLNDVKAGMRGLGGATEQTMKDIVDYINANPGRKFVILAEDATDVAYVIDEGGKSDKVLMFGDFGYTVRRTRQDRIVTGERVGWRETALPKIENKAEWKTYTPSEVKKQYDSIVKKRTDYEKSKKHKPVHNAVLSRLYDYLKGEIVSDPQAANKIEDLKQKVEIFSDMLEEASHRGSKDADIEVSISDAVGGEIVVTLEDNVTGQVVYQRIAKTKPEAEPSREAKRVLRKIKTLVGVLKKIDDELFEMYHPQRLRDTIKDRIYYLVSKASALGVSINQLKETGAPEDSFRYMNKSLSTYDPASVYSIDAVLNDALGIKEKIDNAVQRGKSESEFLTRVTQKSIEKMRDKIKELEHGVKPIKLFDIVDSLYVSRDGKTVIVKTRTPTTRVDDRGEHGEFDYVAISVEPFAVKSTVKQGENVRGMAHVGTDVEVTKTDYRVSVYNANEHDVDSVNFVKVAKDDADGLSRTGNWGKSLELLKMTREQREKTEAANAIKVSTVERERDKSRNHINEDFGIDSRVANVKANNAISAKIKERMGKGWKPVRMYINRNGTGALVEMSRENIYGQENEVFRFDKDGRGGIDAESRRLGIDQTQAVLSGEYMLTNARVAIRSKKFELSDLLLSVSPETRDEIKKRVKKRMERVAKKLKAGLKDVVRVSFLRSFNPDKFPVYTEKLGVEQTTKNADGDEITTAKDAGVQRQLSREAFELIEKLNADKKATDPHFSPNKRFMSIKDTRLQFAENTDVTLNGTVADSWKSATAAEKVHLAWDAFLEYAKTGEGFKFPLEKYLGKKLPKVGPEKTRGANSYLSRLFESYGTTLEGARYFAMDLGRVVKFGDETIDQTMKDGRPKMTNARQEAMSALARAYLYYSSGPGAMRSESPGPNVKGTMHFKSAEVSPEEGATLKTRGYDGALKDFGYVRHEIGRTKRDEPIYEWARKNGRDSAEQKSSSTEYPNAGREVSRMNFKMIGAERREQIGDMLRKYRPGLDIGKYVSELEKFDTTKEQKAALHWVIRGGLSLPEDSYKISEALGYAESAPRALVGARETLANADRTIKAAEDNLAAMRETGDENKIDRAEQRLSNARERIEEARRVVANLDGVSTEPFGYKSPDEMILALHDFKTREPRIDPSTVPELSDARDEGDGIVSYLVQDDRDGQAAMRRIIDTHWGEDANPWCLLARRDIINDPEAESSVWDDEENGRVVADAWKRLSMAEKRMIATELAEGPFGTKYYSSMSDEEMSEYSPYDSPGLYDLEMSDYLLKRFKLNLPHAGDLEVAWSYWQNYSALPKRVAFKNGKLLAFMATDGHLGNDALRNLSMEYGPYFEQDENGEGVQSFTDWVRENHPEEFEREMGNDEEWWDRKDESHLDLDWARSSKPSPSQMRFKLVDSSYFEAKGDTMMLKLLEEAKRLHKRGMNMGDIYRRTLWGMEPFSKKWVSEVPDFSNPFTRDDEQGLKIAGYVNHVRDTGRSMSGPLRAILTVAEADDMRAAAGDVFDTARVRFVNSGETGYDTQTNTIQIALKDMDGNDKPAEELHASLLEETQHLIQDARGMASGASPDDYRQIDRVVADEIEGIVLDNAETQVVDGKVMAKPLDNARLNSIREDLKDAGRIRRGVLSFNGKEYQTGTNKQLREAVEKIVKAISEDRAQAERKYENTFGELVAKSQALSANDASFASAGPMDRHERTGMTPFQRALAYGKNTREVGSDKAAMMTPDESAERGRNGWRQDVFAVDNARKSGFRRRTIDSMQFKSVGSGDEYVGTGSNDARPNATRTWMRRVREANDMVDVEIRRISDESTSRRGAAISKDVARTNGIIAQMRDGKFTGSTEELVAVLHAFNQAQRDFARAQERLETLSENPSLLPGEMEIAENAAELYRQKLDVITEAVERANSEAGRRLRACKTLVQNDWSYEGLLRRFYRQNKGRPDADTARGIAGIASDVAAAERAVEDARRRALGLPPLDRRRGRSLFDDGDGTVDGIIDGARGAFASDDARREHRNRMRDILRVLDADVANNEQGMHDLVLAAVRDEVLEDIEAGRGDTMSDPILERALSRVNGILDAVGVPSITDEQLREALVWRPLSDTDADGIVSSKQYADIGRRIIERVQEIKRGIDRDGRADRAAEPNAVRNLRRELAAIQDGFSMYDERHMQMQMRIGELLDALAQDPSNEALRGELNNQYDAILRRERELLDDPTSEVYQQYVKDIVGKLNAQSERLNERADNGEFATAFTNEQLVTADRDPAVAEARRRLKEAQQRFYKLAAEAGFSKRNKFEKAWANATTIVDFSRTLRTTLDASATWRQGAIYLASHPIKAAQLFGKQMQAMMSGAKSEELWRTMSPELLNEMQTAGLAVEDPDSKQSKDDAYNVEREGGRVQKAIGKIMDLGPIAGSERAYKTALNYMRSSLYTSMRENVMKAQGKPLSMQQMQEIAQAVNIATGSGVLPRGAGKGLNMIFWAPKLMASRVEYLLWIDVAKAKDPAVRKVIAKEKARALLGMALIIAVAKAVANGFKSPEDEEEDEVLGFGPLTDTNWASVEVGDSHIDLTGGLASYLTFGARAVTGVKHDIGGHRKGPGEWNKADEAYRFARKKFNPILGMVFDIYAGTNVIGEKVSPYKAVLWDSWTPLAAHDLAEALSDNESASQGALVGIMSLLGAGGQTYATGNRTIMAKVDTYTDAQKALRQCKMDGDEAGEAQVRRDMDADYPGWADNSYTYFTKTGKEKRCNAYDHAIRTYKDAYDLCRQDDSSANREALRVAQRVLFEVFNRARTR